VEAGYRPTELNPDGGAAQITAPATEEAARWAGFGTALKPGQEMWWLARKPLAAGTVAANVLEHGTGALNIDGCRVDGGSRPARTNEVSASGLTGTGGAVAYGSFAVRGSIAVGETTEGRWPTNIVFTHSASCQPIGAHEVKNHGHSPAARGAGGIGTSGHKGQDGLTELRPGTETVEAWVCAPDCPVGELDRQSGVLTSGTGAVKRASGKGGSQSASIGAESRSEGTPMLSYGDTGGASRFYPTFHYQAKAPASERPRLEDGTAHETVKSLGLMKWMVRLITPPGGTVLDMFAGSGPVGEVAIIEGFRAVLIEQDPKSAELIKTRLRKPIQPVMFGMEDAS
jgi:DNA methylase